MLTSRTGATHRATTAFAFRAFAVAAAALVLGLLPPATAASFSSILSGAGFEDFLPTSLSSSGTVFGLGAAFGAGFGFAPPSVPAFHEAWSWDAGQFSIVADARLFGAPNAFLTAVSSTRVAVGASSLGGRSQAAVWGANLSPPTLISQVGSPYGVATAISADGLWVAGAGYSAPAAFGGGKPQSSFLASASSNWTAASLGPQPLTPLAFAAGGNALVGQIQPLPNPSSALAFALVSGLPGGAPNLQIPFPGMSVQSAVVAASDPVYSGGDSSLSVAANATLGGSQQAFLFNKAFGSGLFVGTQLGTLPGMSFSKATQISSDGSMVVGTSGDGSTSKAFIWTQAGGLADLGSYLGGLGINNLNGWQLQSATALSADGKYVAGTGINPSGQVASWLAHIGAPSSPRTLFAFLGASGVVSIQNAADWRDAAGNAVAPPPGQLDDYFIRTPQKYQQLPIDLGSNSVVHSIEFGRQGIYTASGGSLAASGTFTITEAALNIGGPANISADKLVVTSPFTAQQGLDALLALGASNAGTGPAMTFKTAEVQKNGKVIQFSPPQSALRTH